jgi:hypothetical protein
MGGEAHTDLPSAKIICAYLRLDTMILYRKELVKFRRAYKRDLTFYLTFRERKVPACEPGYKIAQYRR